MIFQIKVFELLDRSSTPHEKGANSVIGAGSVVVKDIPEGVVAVGNPAKVIRKITDADRMERKKGIQ